MEYAISLEKNLKLGFSCYVELRIGINTCRCSAWQYLGPQTLRADKQDTKIIVFMLDHHQYNRKISILTIGNE